MDAESPICKTIARPPLLRLIASFLLLGHLCRSLGTSRGWKDALCSSPRLWTQLDVRFLPITQASLEVLIRRSGSTLRELRLDGIGVNNNLLKLLTAQTPQPHLELLTLFGTNVTLKGLVQTCNAMQINRVYAFDCENTPKLSRQVPSSCLVNGLHYEQCVYCGKEDFCYNCTGCSRCALCDACRQDCDDAEFTWCTGCLAMYCSDSVCNRMESECEGGCFRNNLWWCNTCAGWKDGKDLAICKDCALHCTGCLGTIDLWNESEKGHAVTCSDCSRLFCGSMCFGDHQRKMKKKQTHLFAGVPIPCTLKPVQLSGLPLKFHGLLS